MKHKLVTYELIISHKLEKVKRQAPGSDTCCGSVLYVVFSPRSKLAAYYYFTHSGRILRHSTKYIKVKGGEVEFIYTPGTNHNERYNDKCGVSFYEQ